MKTKVLKTVAPVFAFLMAIGLAFATGTTDNSQTGYYFDPDLNEIMEVDVDCDSSSSEICTYNNQPVFEDRGLTDFLFKTAHP